MGNIKVKKIVNDPVNNTWLDMGMDGRLATTSEIDDIVESLREHKPERGISREQAQINIVEWLYINDGKFPNKLDWRTEFLAMVEWNLKHIK